MPYSLDAPVIKNVKFPNHNYLVSLRAPKVAQQALPGQFVMAAQVDDSSIPYPLLRRALAVYSTTQEDGEKSIINLLLKIVGDGTLRLASLEKDDTVNLIGPLGNSFNTVHNTSRKHFLVAGGIGIASFYLLAEQLRQKNQEVHLIYGGQTADDLVGLEDFQMLDIPVYVTTNDGSQGFKGLVTEGLEIYLQKVPYDNLTIYTCGPTPMMKAVSDLAAHHSIACQISVEAKMACGFGVCLGCSVKTTDTYRLACQHGPIFDASEFIWENE